MIYKYNIINYIMPSKISQEALDKGVITKKQYDKLPPPLLDKVAKHNLALDKKKDKKKKKK